MTMPADRPAAEVVAKAAYDALPRHLQLFVDMLDAGGTLEEAARAGGSQAKSVENLRTTALRWRDEPRVQAALEERRARYETPGTDEWSLLEEARIALSEVLKQKDAPQARIRAVELVLRVAGKLGRKDIRHQHAHLHVGVPATVSLPPAEEARMLGIALRGKTVRCPSCGAQVPLDVEASS